MNNANLKPQLVPHVQCTHYDCGQFIPLYRCSLGAVIGGGFRSGLPLYIGKGGTVIEQVTVAVWKKFFLWRFLED